MSFLKGAGIRWSGTHLDGELKSAPVKVVLKDLIEYQGVVCKVTGDLQGTISMTINNLTIEETIHKIMRNSKYNYTMIYAEPESPGGSHVAVSELTIYQGNESVRFVKVPKVGLAVKPKPVEPAPMPAVSSPIEESVRKNVVADEDLEKLDREVRSLLEEMLADEKMSRQEYDEALQSFSSENSGTK